MIRRFQDTDIDIVLKIWLNTNITTHNFIPIQYWKENEPIVKDMFYQSDIYVYVHEQTNQIIGFIGLIDCYIAGIFVDEKYQSHHIGKQLLDFVKKKKVQLTLSVYEKNKRAIKFYQRENFVILSQKIDENTQECEYEMIWYE